MEEHELTNVLFEPLTTASKLDTQDWLYQSVALRRYMGADGQAVQQVCKHRERDVVQLSILPTKPPVNHGKVFALVTLLDFLVDFFCFCGQF
jgi:hypothetical protein